jgi:transcription initiation factor IIE alpha subunit
METHGQLFYIFVHENTMHSQYNQEDNKLAKCPKCGAEVAKPKKTWKMAGRPDKQGKRMQLEIGLFECPKCHATFREVLSKKKI